MLMATEGCLPVTNINSNKNVVEAISHFLPEKHSQWSEYDDIQHCIPC
jgi:hypothetical protein